MQIDPPKEQSDDSHPTTTPDRDAFDIRALETMAEDEADAEWLRHPEAWHLH